MTSRHDDMVEVFRAFRFMTLACDQRDVRFLQANIGDLCARPDYYCVATRLCLIYQLPELSCQKLPEHHTGVEFALTDPCPFKA